MLKKELISAIAEKTEHTKKSVTEVLDALNDVIIESLQNGEQEVVLGLGVGKFVVKDVAERTGRNPVTGESIVTPAHKAIKFKMSNTLKKLLR